MKIIFLDFDGVIRVQLSEGGWAVDSCDFCPNRIQMIAKICEVTGSKIVVSSDWRNFDNREEIEGYLGRAASHMHEDWATPICGHRHNEIERWLDAHPDSRQFVILDDFAQHFEGAAKSISDRLVLCNNRHGLVPNLMPDILRHLS